jgi:sec-independent protein translocase protein TatC
MTDSHEPELLPPDPDESAKDSSMFKPFLDHLEDLRWMIIKMVVALSLTVLLSFFFAQELLAVLVWPLKRVTDNPQPFLRTLEVTGGFTLAMTLSLYAGIVIACPFLLYFLAEFILPALTQRAR